MIGKLLVALWFFIVELDLVEDREFILYIWPPLHSFTHEILIFFFLSYKYSNINSMVTHTDGIWEENYSSWGILPVEYNKKVYLSNTIKKLLEPSSIFVGNLKTSNRVIQTIKFHGLVLKFQSYWWIMLIRIFNPHQSMLECLEKSSKHHSKNLICDHSLLLLFQITKEKC